MNYDAYLRSWVAKYGVTLEEVRKVNRENLLAELPLCTVDKNQMELGL